MIDQVLFADETKATTSLFITAENIFVETGVFKEPGLIENIAQTAAAQVGYLCKQKNTAVPIGYIAAIRYLEISTLPPVGSTLTTTIVRKNQIMDIILIEGSTLHADKEVCKCEMRVFIKSDS
jgi:predicted hotdog family 3-hydroxylacyl-ACP dehydratase